MRSKAFLIMLAFFQQIFIAIILIQPSTSLHSMGLGILKKIETTRQLSTAIESGCGVEPLALVGPKGEDVVWKNMRRDAEIEASREPLLASFMHATILSHSSLEKSLAFHMANQLSSPAMISTQIQALFLEALENSPGFGTSLRMDILAVMNRSKYFAFIDRFYS